ncbi:hypothetical protein GCM10007304_35390 [Rhodococcoides trifolii]|uniref:Uncharacterized protein n=1 Tax=Rhodococcoides trifolii TaxID=908250 RepID=A0A917G1J4_9NOCA|nr:hypothetical protein [Rhodococcus trifolii]GGG18335.1 hypothetical protein GCM10007304_35390 [Rhodococcus trifolii]
MEPNPLFLAPSNPESEAAETAANSPVTDMSARPAPSYTGLFSEAP